MDVNDLDFLLWEAEAGNRSASQSLLAELAVYLSGGPDLSPQRKAVLAQRFLSLSNLCLDDMKPHKAHSEISKALGLRRSRGGQRSNIDDEYAIYSAIILRMMKGGVSKRSGKVKPYGYKKAINALFDEKHPSLKRAPNTDQQNFRRIYRKFSKAKQGI